MGERAATFQNKSTISLPRKSFLDRIVYNEDLDKKELRVVMILLTELDGFSEYNGMRKDDPNNFKMIKMKQIADNLGIDKHKVSDIVDHLVDINILEKGDSHTGSDGYRFTF